jgi:hypothetical protein
MKNLSSFDSFVQSLTEGVQEWDLKRAQTAIDDLKKKSSSLKDSEPTGLSFTNIQKVFGNIDYPTRFKIAQALMLVGKNLFPVNRYDKSGVALDPMTGLFITKYIGEKDQNLKMDKISENLLKAIKPIVDDFDKDVDGYFNQKTSASKPTVKQSKVASDKISE